MIGDVKGPSLERCVLGLSADLYILAPTVIGLFSDTNRTSRLTGRMALTQPNLNCSQLCNNLFYFDSFAHSLTTYVKLTLTQTLGHFY
jgi:hypothetical protein